ncbi:hypothetical protein BDW72DRAFT_210594 [Aspergillus terricola var. indicus]
MDPNIQEIIIRFKQLNTASARRTVYHQIIDQLDPHEWREVQKRINQRTFQKDILGSLPLEVAVQIIQYFDVNDVHLLQRVSRRWLEVLSSKPVCSVLFRQYTGGSLDNDFKSTFARYSRQRSRLEQGLPVAHVQLDIPFSQDLDYCDGRYAWSADGGTTIVVFELCSRKTQRFCTENRERLERFRLSENLVAAITIRGYCHAWDLRTEYTRAVRLPNTNLSHFVIGGFRVAVYYENLRIDGQEGGVVMHFDLRPGSPRTHRIQRVKELALLSLDTSSNYLTAISLKHHSKPDPSRIPNWSCLYVVKYELHENGEVSTARSYTLRLPSSSERACLARNSPHYCRNLGVLYVGSSSALSFVLPITYHPRTEQVCIHPLLDPQMVHSLTMANIDNGILYWVRDDDGRQSIWISNPYAVTPLYASRGLEFDLPGALPDEASLMIHTRLLLTGDFRFVSMTDVSGTRVWSFEDDAKQLRYAESNP